MCFLQAKDAQSRPQRGCDQCHQCYQFGVNSWYDLRQFSVLLERGWHWTFLHSLMLRLVSPEIALHTSHTAIRWNKKDCEITNKMKNWRKMNECRLKMNGCPLTQCRFFLGHLVTWLLISRRPYIKQFLFVESSYDNFQADQVKIQIGEILSFLS